MKKNIIFIIFAVLFIIAALYHIVALFVKVNDSPLWRNLLFTVICLFVAFCLWKRFQWFIYVFFLLMIQQFYSHGSDLISLWQTQHKIDWISVVVLLILPTIFVFLLLDKLGKLDTNSGILSKSGKLMLVMVFAFTFQSCYHYRVLNTVNDPASVQYHQKVLWSYFWGLVDSPQTFTIPDCENGGIDEVRITTTLPNNLLTIVTLGIVCPVQVQWKCHKPCQRVGGL